MNLNHCLMTAESVGTNVDMTERKQAENKLKDSEERFRMMANAMPQLAWIADSEGFINWYNLKWYEYTGTTPAQMEGWGWQTVHDPAVLPAVLERWKASIASGQSFEMEFPLRGADGRFRTFLTRVNAYKDAQGRVVQWFGTNTDVNEQKRVEDALRVSETRFRFMADEMPQIVWTSQPNGKLDYCNQRWFDYTGVTFQPSEEWGSKSVLHPDDYENCVKQWKFSLQTGRPYEVEHRFKRASDGTYRWHLGRALPRSDETGTIIEWVGTCTDIHDQKMIAADLERAGAELELKIAERTRELHNEMRFVDAVLKNITDGIIACDSTGRVTYLNDAIREMLGIVEVPDEMSASWVAEHLVLYDRTSCRRVPWEERPLARALQKMSVDDAEFTIKSSTGQIRSIVASSRPMLESSGNVSGAVAVLHDVTELHRSKREILAAKEAAEAASSAKGDFLANMSHEIRTPMTSIIGYADLLSTTECSQEDRQEFVQTIRRNGEHLLNLINDLLDLSKIDAGKMTVECISVSPEKILAEVESPMRVLATNKQIDFIIERHGYIPPLVHNDPTRIRQVLLNLVSNAIKFTNSGCVRIGMSFDVSSRMLTYLVQDTGIGLTEEHRASLFQPFMQADASTTRRFGGTGLGLALSKRLVEMLGGTLTVESTAGQGSTFSFSVCDCSKDHAIADHSPSWASTPERREVSRRSNARILLAEDAADNRRLVTIYLEQAGMTVDHAADGRIAINKALAADSQGAPYDAILMDMQMPELDGYAATRELRASGLTKVPVIAFTAHAMESERQRCTDAGCNGFVTKPVNPTELIETIIRHVSGMQPADQHQTDKTTPLITADAGDSVPTKPFIAPAPVSAPRSDSVIKSTMSHYPELKDVIAEYVAALPAAAKELEDLAAAQNLQALRRLAHQMRGTGGGYGFDSITDFAGQLEDSIREDKSLDLVRKQVVDLLAILQRIEGCPQTVR